MKAVSVPVEARWAELKIKTPTRDWYQCAVDSCISPKAPVGFISLLSTGAHFCRESRALEIIAWAETIPGFVHRGRPAITHSVHISSKEGPEAEA